MTTHSNSYQVGGDHYTKATLQPWDVMQAWMKPEIFHGFLIGNVIKYVYRAGSKGIEVEDFKKAQHYLQKLINVIEGNIDD